MHAQTRPLRFSTFGGSSTEMSLVFPYTRVKRFYSYSTTKNFSMEDEYDDDDFEEERPSGENSRGQSLHHITPIHHRTVRKTKSKTAAQGQA